MSDDDKKDSDDWIVWRPDMTEEERQALTRRRYGGNAGTPANPPKRISRAEREGFHGTQYKACEHCGAPMYFAVFGELFRKSDRRDARLGQHRSEEIGAFGSAPNLVIARKKCRHCRKESVLRYKDTNFYSC